jgi:hypothetical protein
MSGRQATVVTHADSGSFCVQTVLLFRVLPNYKLGKPRRMSNLITPINFVTERTFGIQQFKKS